jgi:hypothetical protein
MTATSREIVLVQHFEPAKALSANSRATVKEDRIVKTLNEM